MGIDLGRFGVWRRVGEIPAELAVAVEELGYGAIWVGGSPPGDLTAIEEVLQVTERIPVVTGIVNIWRDDAATAGRSYLRIEERYPDRFVLGIGVGHPEGIKDYRKPLVVVGDYIDRLRALGVPKDRLVLAALGPRALRLAAERTAGAHPYLTTPRHTEMARRVMGEGPLLAPEHKVILGDGDARERGRRIVSRYLRLVNYRRNLLREGWKPADLDGGGSDQLVDALVLHGDAEKVAAGLRAHLDAGADHLGIQALGDDPLAEYRTLAGFLLR
ncbi:MAG: TIGR03620 family F420-dependent LLM class oxidoreductase [Acidimicrobiia bacterium]